MNQSILNQFRLTVQEKNLNIYGIKVENADGESISHRWRADDFVNIYSGSKTFTSMAVGLCIDDGKLSLDNSILDLFPEYKKSASAGSEQITIRDLLHMSSGKETFWFGQATDDERFSSPEDWAKLFFDVPVTKKPGTCFYYSNACTYMLGRAVEKVSGETVRNFLLPRFFIPLDIFNPQWHVCTRGHSLSATGLFLTTDQFSRLGLTLLNGGVYKGKRVISERYLQNAINDLNMAEPAGADEQCNKGYGYQIWRCAYPGAYRADGKYGQFSIVLPDKKSVVTVTSHQEVYTNDIIRAIFSDIVPQL